MPRRATPTCTPVRTRPRGARTALAAAAVALAVVLAVVLTACSPADEPGQPGDQPEDTEQPSPPVDPTGPAEDDPTEPDAPEDRGPDEPDTVPEAPEPREDEAPDRVLDTHGVSAGHPEAVAVGLEVLDEGGSAVDAAVATAFAVAVVEPFASGLGGGGAVVMVDDAGAAQAYDYREVVNQDGVIPSTDTGVPGFVAGMQALHEDHGELSWTRLLDPAITLAAEGVPTPDIVADQLRSGAGRLAVASLPQLYPDGAALGPGAPMVQPELADTLRELRDGGPQVFYTGAVADTLAADVDGLDGPSLEAYEVQRSEPPRGRVGDHQVVGAAPPLPGAALVQLLQVAAAAGVGEAAPGSADYVDTLTDAWEVADATVQQELGDPGFVDVPVDRLTDADRNAEVAGTEPAGGPDVPDRSDVDATAVGNTTHVTVVDGDGTTVSMTNTITNFWGSGQEVAGFFLNDQLGRFSVGTTEANRPEPGRRSVSWSLPAVVTDDTGRPVLGLGSPGGRRIPSILADVVTRWAIHDQDLATAVEAPRFHLDGGVLYVERLPDDEVAGALRDRGYVLEVPSPPYYFGSVQALAIDHERGEVLGAVDPRRDGSWDSAPAP